MTAKRFEGKCVVVTGGASGIGRASAEMFAAEGANLAIADMNFDGAGAVADALSNRYGIKAVPIAFNAAQADSCRAMIDSAVAALDRLDVLCNIAGVMDWGPVEQFTDDRWERVMAINLNSLFYITKQALPHLIKSKGNVVNMASAAGLVGIAYSTAYCCSKAGVIALTKSLAIEVASAGVRINAICPSGVKTPMHTETKFPEGVDINLLMRNAPKLNGGELAEPTDIASAVLYLASDEARYISGTALAVDGAQTAG